MTLRETETSSFSRSPSGTRPQVMAQLCDEIVALRADGLNDTEIQSAARIRFFGLPDPVFWEAWATVEFQETEAWWIGVERTIDGEIVRRALTGGNQQ